MLLPAPGWAGCPLSFPWRSRPPFEILASFPFSRDLSGEEILPVAYGCVCCSAQGMYAASNPETSMMEVYDAGGNLTSSWNATIYGDAGFYGYGTEIRNEAAMYTLSGEEIPPVYDLYMLSLNNIGDDSDELVFPYFFTVQTGYFMAWMHRPVKLF